MEAKPDRQLKVGLALLAVLVGFGLIPTVAGSLYAWGVIPHYHQPVLSVYTLGVLITASALILWERRRLPQFHIDGLVLGIVILAPVLQWAYGLPFRGFDVVPEAYLRPWWPKLAVDAALLALLVALRAKAPRPGPVAWAFVAGALVFVAAGLVGALTAPPGGIDPRSLPMTTLTFLVALTRWATYEGLIMVVFLWGYLRLLGWRDERILVAQTVLFMLFHIFLIPGRPAVFLIVVPATALAAGLLAWKNRSAAPSMIVYALVSIFVSF